MASQVIITVKDGKVVRISISDGHEETTVEVEEE